MFYITLIFALFATTNARLIGNDPNTWSPKSITNDNIIIPSNTLLKNNTDTWTPIISYSSIILEDDLDKLDKKIEQYKLPTVTRKRESNSDRYIDDDKLPKFISDMIDWFKIKKTPVNYNNRRLLL